MKKLLIALIVLAMVSLLCARVVYGQQLPGGERPFSGVATAPNILRLASGNLFRVRGFFSEVSSDGGKTWSRGGQMHPFAVPESCASMETAIQLQAGPHKGRVLVPWYLEMDGDHPDYSRVQRGGYAIWKGKKIRLEFHTHVPEMAGSFVCYSDDEGKTWQRSKGFLMGYFEDGNLGHWSCEEPAIAELKDGRILCFMRSACGRILKSYSSDGGQYWTKVEATDIAMSNSPCALSRIPKTGDLVMVWNQMSAEEICKGHRRGRLSLAISKDDGQTWENFKTLELNPGLEDLKQVSPPPLAPMVRGPSGPDHLMGTIPDGFRFYGYPTIYWSEDKIFITYGTTDPVTGRRGVRLREFPILWLYEQSEKGKNVEMLPSEAPQGSAKDRIQAAPAANPDGITLEDFKPRYRVLFNQDCSDLFVSTREPITPQHVDRMVDEIADGGADVLLINVNCWLTSYPSKVWQTFWDGYKEGDRSFFGGVPDKSIPRREHYIKQKARLAEQCDYLARALARCRKKGIAPGISLRMNDMHDAPWPSSHVFSRFYKENPQLHLKPLDGRGWGRKGMDYAHPEVREHFLSLIRELAQGYDFDVLELDFMRFQLYFDRDNIDQHCKTMTGFIREVRQILDSSGRHIALIPRIASSPGTARQLGFDVQAWAREGLVDGITPAKFWGSQWDIPIAEFRSLVGPDVAVYASAGVSADCRDGLPSRYLPESYEMLRGFAAGYLAIGADGINTFNFFLARHHHPVTAEEFFGGLREMRSLEEARGKPRIHMLTAGGGSSESNLIPVQVPMVVNPNKAQRFEMLLAAEVLGQKVEALVYFDGEGQADDLWLRIGLHSVGHAVEIREGPTRETKDTPAHETKIAVFNVPSGVIKDGRNQLIVRSERVSTTILGIDVYVR